VALPAFAAERRAAIDRYLLPQPARISGVPWPRQTDGRMDRRTPDRYIDPAPHAMRAVPIIPDILNLEEI